MTAKPPLDGDGTQAPAKQRFWWRFGLAGVIIVAVAAAATATSVLLYLDSISEALAKHSKHLTEEVQDEIKEVHGGEPQTILILGSDMRANLEEEFGRSDTTILLRINPEKGLISVMSIPRDLEVEIPEYGTDKFNAAYSVGGPKLTLKVVKELTGLPINHVVNVDFLGFVRAVDAIGCVYTDVDRRYYHSNEGVPESLQYSEINIKPGYQKLCGKKALQYVRYRHTDTDIVRSARQQNFMAQARKQVPLTSLLDDQNGLIEIFTDYTTSDLHNTDELITLLDLLIEARNSEVRQVHFPAELTPTDVFVNDEELERVVAEFKGEIGAESSESSEKKTKKKRKKGKGGAKKRKSHKPHVKAPPRGGDELVPASEAGEAEAKVVARKVGGGFPIFYPTRLPSGAVFVETNPYEKVVDPRVYHLKDKDKERHPAYRMVGEYGPEYETTYFGIQGIKGWEDPPILDDPSETKEINGREYDIYVDSGTVTMVAWHRGANSYWVSNSLQQSLTNDQMLGIARSAHLKLPNPKPKKKRKGGKTG